MTKDRLYQLLKDLPGDPEVFVEEDRGLVATVSTPAFGDRHEALRQQMVWEHLGARCSDEDLANVVFIFALPPRTKQAG